MQGTVAYRIATERLLVRAFELDDAACFRALLDRNDQHLRPWIPWMRHEPMPLADTVKRVAGFREAFGRDECRYLVFAGDVLVGLTGLHERVGKGALEIGYLLDRDAGGKGYAMEMSVALIRSAFELQDIERIEIHCSPDNLPSAAIPRKLGFSHATTLLQHSEDSEGDMQDSMVWVLTRAQYAAESWSTAPVAAWDDRGVRLL